LVVRFNSLIILFAGHQGIPTLLELFSLGLVFCGC
jgi:hypothetical protein